jgi:GNAT superfamily N-acetyltransferase
MQLAGFFDTFIMKLRSYFGPMEVTITRTELDVIKDLRAMFLHENRFQFVCNKCHDYGWADTWQFGLNGIAIGYGSVWGTDRRQDRDTIFEFYLVPLYRHLAAELFPKFRDTCGAVWVESQSNDLLLTSMLYIYGSKVVPEAILFEDSFQTHFAIPGAVFRERSSSDPLDGDDSEYVISYNGQIVATGGLMLNYNFPYADIYMAVKEQFRRAGFGSLIVQELKRAAYERGRVPAARCNIVNRISQATLQKAGFKICGFRLKALSKREG